MSRLPLWPKAGLNWSNHPGHDIYTGLPDIGLGPNSTILYSDPAGLIAINNQGTITVADLANGQVKSIASSDGVLIPKTGWYRSRNEKAFLPSKADLEGVGLTPLTTGAGNLEAGRYSIWALTFVRLETGFFFIWYSVASAALTATGGFTIKLAEIPGERIVRLYVQRAKANEPLSPLAFLGELTGENDTFEYTSHAQEGEYVSLAFPRATGTWAAYYNGRYYYQADHLVVIGESGSATPTTEMGYIDVTNGGTFGFDQHGLAFTNIAANAAKIGIWAYSTHDVTVETPAGLFAANRYGGNTFVYHSTANGEFFDWSLVYSNIVEHEFTCAAYSPSRIVLAGKGGKVLVGRLQNNEFFSPSSWEMPTLPASTDINDIIWTGSEFVALTSRGILRGGLTGQNWTLVSAPASLEPTFTDWRRILFHNNKFYIYAAEPNSGYWRAEIFVYDGATWTTFDPYVRLGSFTIYDGRFMGFNAMFIKDNLLYVGHVLQPGWYGTTFLHNDTFIIAAYRLSDMQLELIYSGIAPTPVTNYGKEYLWGNKTALLFRNGNTYRLLRMNQDYTTTFALHTSGLPISGMFLKDGATVVEFLNFVTNRISLPILSSLAFQFGPTLSPSVVGRVADGRGVYSFGSNLYTVSAGLRTRRYGVPLDTVAAAIIENSKIAFATTRSSVALVHVGNTPEDAVMVRRVDNYSNRAASFICYVGSKAYFAYPRATGYSLVFDSTEIQIAEDVVGLAWDGTDLFVGTTTNVYKLTGSVLTSLQTGTFTGVGDAGTGNIYIGVSNGDVLQLDTAANTTTLVGTLPSTTLRTARLIGTVPVVLGINSVVYYYNTTFQTVASYSSGAIVTNGVLGTDSTITNGVTLEKNTVIWTEPNHINIMNPFHYHTFVPRMSREINDIIPHPAGVMVLMDNETYVMSGKFTNITDTRVALYPQTIGLDKGARLGMLGPNVFTVWNGKIFQIGDGEMRLVSATVDDDVHFTAALIDHPNSMLVGLKKDGRVLRYDLTRQVWFNDMDDCLNIAQTVQGIAYLRQTMSSYISTPTYVLYKLADTQSPPTTLYYQIPQELWIDAVALNNEPLKRLRAIRFSLKSSGPAGPFLRIYNESEIEVISQAMTPTVAANAFGLGRYQARFTPVIGYSPARIKISFSGFSFEMPPFIEVDYEARNRKA